MQSKYFVEVSEELDKKFFKLKRKNKHLLVVIWKKVEEIRVNPYHYKPLKGKMKGIRRVHIDKHFVLIFSVVEKRNVVLLLDFDHHDTIY